LSANRAVDALLFDLGGVVIDVDWNRVFEAWADRARVSAADVAARFAFDAPYEAHERGEIGRLRRSGGRDDQRDVALDDDAFLAGWNSLFVGPVAGMPALLERLARSYRLYGFSNTNRAHVAHWQPRYRDLLQPFAAIYCSCDLGARKPDAAAFHEVANRIGAAPQRLVFFDDTEANVLGARAAGLMAAHVRSAAEVESALGRFGVRVDEPG